MSDHEFSLVPKREPLDSPSTSRYRQVLGGTADLPRARPLTEALEFLQGEAELAEDLVEEWRSDLSATMDGNRHGPAIGWFQRSWLPVCRRLTKPI
jgi:hypothetical protein